MNTRGEPAAQTPRERTKKRLPGRPPKSGSRALSKFIRRNLLDRRTWVSHEVDATADRYAADAGGWEHLSHRERDYIWLGAGLFVELCVRQQARLVRLAEGKVDIDDSDRHYGWLFNSYGRLMDKLGLRPEKIEQLPTLEQYLAAKAPPSQSPPAATMPGEEVPSQAPAAAAAADPVADVPPPPHPAPTTPCTGLGAPSASKEES